MWEFIQNLGNAAHDIEPLIQGGVMVAALLYGGGGLQAFTGRKLRQMAAERVSTATMEAAETLIMYDGDENRFKKALEAFVDEIQENLESDLRTLMLKPGTEKAKREVRQKIKRQTGKAALRHIGDVVKQKVIIDLLEKV